MKVKNFTDLIAWQKSRELVLDVYRVTAGFPNSEMFGLVNQLRRAGVSIISNIAEGFSRSSLRDKYHFNSIALGSLNEIQAQLIIAKDLGYIVKGDYEMFLVKSIEVQKLIHGLNKWIRAKM
jgi:four helix bundle protein